MITIEINNYTGRFPDEHYRLFLDSWSEYIATGAQSKIPRETFDNLFLNNPFGKSYFAAARDNDQLVGSLAAIPFTVATAEDRSFTTYQISVLMVSPQYQRRGVFRKMLEILTQFIIQEINSSIFTFPNDRSLPGFTRHGYTGLSTLPTKIYFPSPLWGLFSCSSDGTFAAPRGKKKLSCRQISLISAMEKITGYTPSFPHFIKDGAYLKWRYFQPEGTDRFYFHRISGPTEDIILISTRHRYGKRVFTVLLEVFNLRHPGIKPSFLPGILMKLSPEKGLPLLYTNEPRLPTAPLSPAWAISLPNFLNPRPIELLIESTSNNEELEKCLLQLDFATADWLGFL